MSIKESSCQKGEEKSLLLGFRGGYQLEIIKEKMALFEGVVTYHMRWFFKS